MKRSLSIQNLCADLIPNTHSMVQLLYISDIPHKREFLYCSTVKYSFQDPLIYIYWIIEFDFDKIYILKVSSKFTCYFKIIVITKINFFNFINI